MKMRTISTKTHGVLDYLVSAVQLVLPRALGWDNKVIRLHEAMALGTTCQSLLTNYELGVVKVLPMKTHLLCDAIGGGILLAAAGLVDDEPPQVRATIAGVGLIYLATALTTKTVPYERRRGERPAGPRPVQRVARQRRPRAAAPLPQERLRATGQP